MSATALLTVLGIVAVCWILALIFEDERLREAIWPTLAIAVLLLAVRVILWRADEGLNVVAFQVLNNSWQGKLQLAWVFNLIAPLLLARAMGEPSPRLAALYWFTWVVAGVATYLLFSRMGSIVFGDDDVGSVDVQPAPMAQGARHPDRRAGDRRSPGCSEQQDVPLRGHHDSQTRSRSRRRATISESGVKRCCCFGRARSPALASGHTTK